jgi:hypothetical protein
MTHDRYDRVSGKLFDDTTATVPGLAGAPKAKPREWDAVVGRQYPVLQNLKLIGECRHHDFADSASAPNATRLEDDGMTIRAMIGF